MKGVSMTVYVVSSLRNYGEGELYYGADGVFQTREAAVRYIEEDIGDTLDDYSELYDDEEIRRQPITKDDTSDYRIDFDDHTFAWRIDEFALIAEGYHDS